MWGEGGGCRRGVSFLPIKKCSVMKRKKKQTKNKRGMVNTFFVFTYFPYPKATNWFDFCVHPSLDRSLHETVKVRFKLNLRRPCGRICAWQIDVIYWGWGGWGGCALIPGSRVTGTRAPWVGSKLSGIFLSIINFKFTYSIALAPFLSFLFFSS